MEHIIAGQALQLSYACGIGVAELAPAPFYPFAVPASVSQMVLATHRQSGVSQAMLAVHEWTIGDDKLRQLELQLGPDAGHPRSLARRMSALAIQRMVHAGAPMPILTAWSRSGALCEALYQLAARLDDRRFYPQPQGNIIPLAAAAVAQRVARHLHVAPRPDATAALLRRALTARVDSAEDDTAPEAMLVVLDLRGVAEQALSEATRWLYQLRPAQQRTPARLICHTRRPAGAPDER